MFISTSIFLNTFITSIFLLWAKAYIQIKYFYLLHVTLDNKTIPKTQGLKIISMYSAYKPSIEQIRLNLSGLGSDGLTHVSDG